MLAGQTSTYGSTAVRLYSPSDMAYDETGNLYVADTSNDRIQKFAPGSTSGTTVSGLTVTDPTAIHIVNASLFYIVDYTNYRIQRWNNGVATIVAGGNGAGATLNKMSTSYELYVDNNLNIYISEYGNHRVTLWTAGNTTQGRIVCTFFVDGI